MLGGNSYRGNTLGQPSYFAAEVSFMDFGAATSLVYLVGILGQYAGGVAADRWNLSWAYLAFQAASLPALLLIGVMNELPLLGVRAGQGSGGPARCMSDECEILPNDPSMGRVDRGFDCRT
jgi:hypothetical protein